MEPGKYRLYIVTRDGREEHWTSFAQYDYKGADWQMQQMRKRLLDERHHGDYKLAKFEEAATRKLLYEFRNGQMVY